MDEPAGRRRFLVSMTAPERCRRVRRDAGKGGFRRSRRPAVGLGRRRIAPNPPHRQRRDAAVDGKKPHGPAAIPGKRHPAAHGAAAPRAAAGDRRARPHNGEINAARDVTKTNTYHPQTFRSRDVGIIGYADTDRIEYYRTPHRRHTAGTESDLTKVEAMPHVSIVYVHTGTRRGEADAMVKMGAKGLVIAGSGAGSPGNVDDEVRTIARDRSAVVVQSTRVGEGRIVRHNNWYWDNYVVADNLNPQKAALLLSLALTRTSEPAEVQRYFDEY